MIKRTSSSKPNFLKRGKRLRLPRKAYVLLFPANKTKKQFVRLWIKKSPFGLCSKPKGRQCPAQLFEQREHPRSHCRRFIANYIQHVKGLVVSGTI